MGHANGETEMKREEVRIDTIELLDSGIVGKLEDDDDLDGRE